jgi:uncharacterized protein DUF362
LKQFCQIHSVGDSCAELVPVLTGALPEGSFHRIVIKPNWVIHETEPDFPIRALVTSTSLIDATIEACIQKYASLESLLVADVPIQSCDWSLLTKQAGIDHLRRKYESLSRPRVEIRDLRIQRVQVSNGYITQDSSSDDFGDPAGYSDVILDQQSFLDPICREATSFRVSDYSPEETKSSHRRGFHRYRISRSLLECDLFINMPKMKTHQKAGLTGALKNIVGMNGNKAFLVHFKAGRPDSGGDEFPPDIEWPIVLQARVHHWAQGKSRLLFRALQKGWRTFRRLYGIEVKATREVVGKRFLLSGGSWYGNDSIWRMIYDLNRIVLHAKPEGGALSEMPQRQYLAIVDGLVAGEGNGPLQPLPVEAGIVGISDNPFVLDFSLARLMGLDHRKIPQLAHHAEFGKGTWGDFDPATIKVHLNGRELSGVDSLPILHPFLPPAGWRGHIELETQGRVA